jgi:hypothetical protein
LLALGATANPVEAEQDQLVRRGVHDLVPAVLAALLPSW